MPETPLGRSRSGDLHKEPKTAETLDQRHPDAAFERLQEIIELSPARTDEEKEELESAVRLLVGYVNKNNLRGERIQMQVVDDAVTEIDRKIGKQLDEILHHPEFQSLESSWRGLKMLVDKSDFSKGIKIDVIDVSKDKLREDLRLASKINQAGLYKLIYTDAYNTWGADPYATMILGYEFGPSAADMELLEGLASIGEHAHAPVIAQASPELFGEETFEKVPNINNIPRLLKGFPKWQALRESERSRYVGMVAPRLIVRPPWDPKDNPVPGGIVEYKEDCGAAHEDYLWGSAVYALGGCIAKSFAKNGWAIDIIGPNAGGEVQGLPIHTISVAGGKEVKIPTEVLIPDDVEKELSSEGVIALTMKKGTDKAAFFDAMSVRRPDSFPGTPEGNEQKKNQMLGLKLPYLFVVSRLAHYLKVMQRENIGKWTNEAKIQAGLDEWIRGYICDMNDPDDDVLSRKPLKSARIEVKEIPGQPGEYGVVLAVVPHPKLVGITVEIRLRGSLDYKEKK